jgi:hypothetical protein
LFPELSRRLGKVMSAPSMLGLTPEERERFIRAVEKAEKFTDLGIEEQFMILRAEREIELLKKQWKQKYRKK